MRNKILGSQAFMSIAVVTTLVVAAVVGYVIAFDPMKQTRAYCALMPDAVGLYPGNHVTMRGINVGVVTATQNQGPKVRVEFEVEADYPVYADASATTVAYSVAADRNLAVISSGDTTAAWEGGCITDTLTPKSITETLTALASLSEELETEDPAGPPVIADGIAAVDGATAGTGPQINEIIDTLGAAMNSPDADIAHLAKLFDSFAAVSDRVAANWGDLESMLTRLTPLLEMASQDLLGPAINLVDGLSEVLPMLNDLVVILGDPIMGSLDNAVPMMRMLQAEVGSLREIVLMMPALTSAFRSIAGPEGGTALTYAAPPVAIPQAEAEQVCAAVAELVPGGCPDPAAGPAGIDLVPLVLGGAK